MSVRILRAFFIRKILDSRFNLSTLRERMDNDSEWWNSRNEIDRGLYGEALRERERLQAATEGELIAELTEIGALEPPPRLGGTPA